MEIHPDLLAVLARHTPEEEDLLSGGVINTENYGSLTQMDSRCLLEPEQVIAIRPHTRFTPFPMHRHNYVELLWQVSGTTHHVMGDGIEIDLRTGELLLFSCHASHAIAAAGEQDIAVNFIVLPDFFDVSIEMVGTNNLIGKFLIDALQQQDSAVDYLHFQISEITPIQLVLESMVASLLEPKYSSWRIDRTSMGLLFLYLLQHTHAISAPAEKNPPHILVVAALREIDQNYKDISFSALARQHHVSAAYLSRIVREATGKTCTQLLQERRLDKARSLIQTTALPIAQICSDVGYQNSSYFYRIFRQRFGELPTAYR